MTPEPVVLVAGGGLARETLAAMRASGEFEPIAVLDDDTQRHGTTIGGVGVVGGAASVADFADARVVVCAGHGRVRRALVDKLGQFGVEADRYVTVIHPAAAIADDTAIGAGSIVLAGVVATADVSVGDHVVIMPNAVLTHDNVIDDFATICAGVALGGSVRVRDGAYLGMNSSVRQGLTVGTAATLGMGAALLTDLPDGETWAGVPARALGTTN